MTSLLRYDAACRAIAEAKSVDEVSEWVDKAAAVREYGRRIKNRQLEIDAIEIRVRAKKRRGEILLELKDRKQLKEGRKKLSPADDSLPVYSLDDLGMTANESSEEQAIAKIDGNSFERLVARCRAYTEANPKLHSFNVLKPPPEGGPINGARTVMGSRVEPDDSLDYFPTPPWATRALMERVWPVAVPGGLRGETAWEPACGEGHIAEVLREYFPTVIATDIHDYGYGQAPLDFLDPAPPSMVADWIITNPPFNDLAEAFVLKALERARAGCAMFLRLQWLETVGRYERIFSKHPPSLIAQFAERVPLHKGRWEPDGDTATAYLWIVWFPARQAARGLTEFLWIPPGCREALTKPDDAERFTAHPVVKAERCCHDGNTPTDSQGHTLDHDADGVVTEAEDESESEAERGAAACESQAPTQDCGEQPTTGDVSLVTAAVDGACPVAAAAASAGPVVARVDAGDAGPTISDDHPFDGIPDFLRRTPVASPTRVDAHMASAGDGDAT